MTHWTEEMFVDHADVFERTLEGRVESADEEVEQLLELVDDHGIDPDTALDVACGIGRHTVELAAQGIEARGLDISPQYVDSARERAEEAGVADHVTVEVGDMRDLEALEGRYDLVTNMWTAFGYFDDETNEQVAAGLRECVADDGALVMDLANKEWMMANYQESSTGLVDGDLHTQRREYTPETGRMETTFALFRGDGEGYEFVGEVEWDLRVYAPAELRRLLERAGFSEVDLYGGLDGSELERASTRLVIVARP